LSGLALCASAAGAADQARVEAMRQGNGVAIAARATIQAPLSVIWQTLTDYDRLAEFIPGMQKSRSLARRGNAVSIEQEGEARFLFFTYPIKVLVEAIERPPWNIEMRMLEGNLKRLDGHYRIEAIDARVDRYVLHFTGNIEPDTSVPAFIAVPLMRANIEDQFRGMITEIERRDAANANAATGARSPDGATAGESVR
jgi:carbon monoxide dehydrogenase subunit G